jgi:hypothetical protein
LEEPPADERLRWRRRDALFSLETDEAVPALSPASNDPDLGLADSSISGTREVGADSEEN